MPTPSLPGRFPSPNCICRQEKDADTKFAEITTGLTLCGLCASIDPERVGVKEAVRESREAGTRVVMITGDYLPTAVAIACNINILLHQSFCQTVM